MLNVKNVILKRSFIFLGSLFFLNGIFLSCDAKDTKTSKRSAEQILQFIGDFEKYVLKTQKQWHAPGVAIALVKDGKIIYLKGFGVREANTQKQVDSHTIFQIASLSKNMLAHVIGKLVEEKKLSFDDPVIKYLPHFFLGTPEITQKFTIRDLLSHRCGLPHFSGDSLWYLGYSVDEIIEGIGKIPLQSPPRTKYGYQNIVYGLSSVIAEKVTGQSIEALFEKYFFNPLSISDASLSLEALQPSGLLKKIENFFVDRNIALPHDVKEGQAYPMPFSSLPFVMAGSTGVNISIAGYAKWLIMLLNEGVYEGKQIISKHTLHQLRHPLIHCNMKDSDMHFPSDRYHNTHYAMGHFVFDYGEKEEKLKIYSHIGAFYGNRSIMAFIPSENFGIVIFSNLGSNRVSYLTEALLNRFLDLYLGLADIDWSERLYADFMSIKMENKRYKDFERLQNPRPAGDLEQYVGVYANDLYGEFTVQLDNQQLILHYRDRVIPLEHFNGNQFNFMGKLLSPAYCSSDVGYAYFGTNNTDANSIRLFQIPGLLHEGSQDGLFTKK